MSCLISLEVMLISKDIPFMKLVSLPKGKQIAIHGPAVNVSTNLDTICNLLPRIPTESQLIPFKLKRRLQYKGHYMFQSVRPDKIMIALKWLKENNELYADIEISQDWQKSWKNYTDENENGVEVLNKEINDNTETINTVRVSLSSESNNQSFELHTMEHLEHLVSRQGFKIVDVEPDGNCFYHAVEKQLKLLNLPNMTHTALRQNLASYLEKENHTENYAAFVAKPIEYNESDKARQDTEPRCDTDDYIDNISNPDDQTEIRWIQYINKVSTGAWADHIAVQAMADMLRVNISIISTLNANTPMTEPSDPGQNLQCSCLHVTLGLLDKHNMFL